MGRITILCQGLLNAGLTTTFVARASKVYIVHEMCIATQWAGDIGTQRRVGFEEWWMKPDNPHGKVSSILQWASDLEVLGNYEVSDGDMVHGCNMGHTSRD